MLIIGMVAAAACAVVVWLGANTLKNLDDHFDGAPVAFRKADVSVVATSGETLIVYAKTKGTTDPQCITKDPAQTTHDLVRVGDRRADTAQQIRLLSGFRATADGNWTISCNPHAGLFLAKLSAAATSKIFAMFGGMIATVN